MPKTDAGNDALVEILQAEAQAIVAGDFAALAALAPLRESALNEIDDTADLTLIRQIAGRNLRLAEAASAGVRAARERLLQALNGASFDIYARNGQRHQFSDSRPKVQRRA